MTPMFWLEQLGEWVEGDVPHCQERGSKFWDTKSLIFLFNF